MLSTSHCTALLQHLTGATLAPARGISGFELAADLAASDHLRDGPAALDSLEQLTAARRVAEFFELEKAGTEELLLRRHLLSEWSGIVAQPYNDGTLGELWFHSGGTTGEPKVIHQSIARLHGEASELAALAPETRRIIALVPLHHIYGFLWGVLLSAKTNVPLVHGQPAIDTVHHDLQTGDLVIGVPEWWHYLGRSGQDLPAGVTGVTSTAPTPAATIETLLAKGLNRMIEVYGSTETAGIGWRDNTADAFQLFSHWSRHDNDHLQGQDRQLYEIPDIVEWPTEQSLKPVKRRDNAVQVGGVNVWPEKIRAFVEQHPQVEACAIRPMATDQGTRLKAFIVPVDKSRDEGEYRPVINGWLREQLPAAERPINLTIGHQLPRNEAGKLCDW